MGPAIGGRAQKEELAPDPLPTRIMSIYKCMIMCLLLSCSCNKHQPLAYGCRAVVNMAFGVEKWWGLLPTIELFKYYRYGRLLVTKAAGLLSGLVEINPTCLKS